MLVIRESQMQAMRDAARVEFLRRLQDHLNAVLVDAVPPGGIDAPRALRAAHALGITSERDIARFAELMFRHAGGPALEGLPPAARNLLLAHGVAPALRLERLAAWCAQREHGARAGG